MLLGTIVDIIPLADINLEQDQAIVDDRTKGILEMAEVEKIGNVFIKLLTKCRHKVRTMYSRHKVIQTCYIVRVLALIITEL